MFAERKSQRSRQIFQFLFPMMILATIGAVGSSPAYADVLVNETLVINYNSRFSSPLVGDAQLFTGTVGNLVQTGTTAAFTDQAGQTETIVQTITDAATAACWIDISGDIVSFPVYAFPAGTSLDNLNQPTSAPIVDTGMSDGTFALVATGPLIAFDAPEIVGTWTLTETPVPEPASLTLTALGLAALGSRYRRHR